MNEENKMVLDAEALLARHTEFEKRKAIYRALTAGYTIKEENFEEPKAQPVLPNPNKKKEQPELTQEQRVRLDRIKKRLKRK